MSECGKRLSGWLSNLWRLTDAMTDDVSIASLSIKRFMQNLHVSEKVREYKLIII